jgi:uncharacterized protein (TIGR02246 family)
MIQSPAMTATRDLYKRFIDGWNAHDAHGMAACLASDGLMIGFDGSIMRGAAEAERVLSQIFAHHTPHRFVTIERSIRMFAPTVACYSGDLGSIEPGTNTLVESLNSRQVMVATQDETGWRMRLLQTTPAALHGQPDLQIALTEELKTAIARLGN